MDRFSSEQRVALARPAVATTDDGARQLGRRYWAEIARCTLGLVRPREGERGVRLVLAGLVTLFRFGPAETRVGEAEVACTFRIEGGLLAARPGGSVTVVQRAKPRPELALVVAGYSPRLATGSSRSVRRLFYTRVQAPLHDAVSRRFLARAAGGRS